MSKIVIGLDVGTSATKVIALENDGRIKPPLMCSGDDTLTSVYGAIGQYLDMNDIKLDDVEHIMATGVGASSLGENIFDIPTTKIDEFLANGLGARFETGLDRMIVVSMGTGTSLVRVDGDEIKHIGGIAMGGGTIKGLSKLLLNTTDIESVNRRALLGLTHVINLTIDDISDTEIDGLPSEMTASLFGKLPDIDTDKDHIAAGIIHMVLETIGSCAILSQLDSGIKDFVLIGQLTQLDSCFDDVFNNLQQWYGVRFHTPNNASYVTALGAALHYYSYEEE